MTNGEQLSARVVEDLQCERDFTPLPKAAAYLKASFQEATNNPDRILTENDLNEYRTQAMLSQAGLNKTPDISL